MIRAPGENAGEAFLMVTYLFPQRIGEVGRANRDETVHAAVNLNACEAVRIGDGQTAQPNGVHQLKNAGVNANAECQRKNCGKGEARTLTQRAECDLQILKAGLEPLASGRLVRGFGWRGFA